MAERLVKLLCALALAVNVLIPAGFMLARTHGSDELTVVICTSFGQQTILMDGNGVPVPADQKSTKKPCDFATSGALALAGDAPPGFDTDVRYAAIAYRVAREAFRRVPKSGTVSARGPPAV